jgi:xylulose-5-phosphate/fructose-6-phosphate phosphoketolase
MSRYHLCIEALRRSGGALPRRAALVEECRAALARHQLYIRDNLEDMPEVRDWVWSGA